MDITRRQFMKILPSGIVAVASSLTSLDNLVAEDGVQEGPKVVTVLDNGPQEKRFDLLFVPEKYAKDKQKDFDKDVDALVAGFEKFDVMKEYKSFFNIHKVWAPSEERRKRSEIDKLGKSDLPCSLVNDPTFKHGTGTFVSLRCRPQIDVFMHELGHGMNLDDEYGKTDFMGGKNVSKDEKTVPWQEIINKKIKGVGIYKVEDGYFKAEEKPCLMQTTEAGTQFGPVCTNLVILYLRKKCGLIEDSTKESPIELVKGSATGIELKLLA